MDPEIEFELHEYAIVMTQDCDLDLDLKARRGSIPLDKQIPDALVCAAVTANELRGRQGIDSQIWRRIERHGHERYHLLSEVPADADLQAAGLPSLGLDFKRHFTMPVAELYRRIELQEARRRSFLLSPYLEHLSTRFAHFQSRVALPER